MDTTFEHVVWRRAKHRCEYCKLPQAFSPLPHQIDHMIARKHGGATDAENLAAACFFCNTIRVRTSRVLILSLAGSCGYSIPGKTAGLGTSYGMARSWSDRLASDGRRLQS